MLFEAAVAKKVDEKRVEMESLKLEALDGEGRKIFVELPQALFNLETRILTGENSAKISREDFEITGDSIEFNTKTRFGTLRGNVKMVISTEGNPK
jgi:lipopolysaccharide assembly outer membrane protein LptD (OstA)